MDPNASAALSADPNLEEILGHRSPSPPESQPPEKKQKTEEEEEEEDDDDDDDEDEETKKLKLYLSRFYLTGEAEAAARARANKEVETVEIEPHLLKKYYDQLGKSEGFDIDDIPGAVRYPLICPVLDRPADSEFYRKYAQAAINHHKKEGKLELLEVLKINGLFVAEPLMFMTFIVRDTTDGKMKTYQAKIKLTSGEDEFSIFREKASTA